MKTILHQGLEKYVDEEQGGKGRWWGCSTKEIAEGETHAYCTLHTVLNKELVNEFEDEFACYFGRVEHVTDRASLRVRETGAGSENTRREEKRLRSLTSSNQTRWGVRVQRDPAQKTNKPATRQGDKSSLAQT